MQLYHIICSQSQIFSIVFLLFVDSLHAPSLTLLFDLAALFLLSYLLCLASPDLCVSKYFSM